MATSRSIPEPLCEHRGSISVEDMNEVVQYLQKYVSKWYKVGIHLRVPKEKLDVFDKNRRDCDMSFYDTIDYWIQNTENPTWEVLEEIVKNFDQLEPRSQETEDTRAGLEPNKASIVVSGREGEQQSDKASIDVSGREGEQQSEVNIVSPAGVGEQQILHEQEETFHSLQQSVKNSREECMRNLDHNASVKIITSNLLKDTLTICKDLQTLHNRPQHTTLDDTESQQCELLYTELKISLTYAKDLKINTCSNFKEEKVVYFAGIVTTILAFYILIMQIRYFLSATLFLCFIVAFIMALACIHLYLKKNIQSIAYKLCTLAIKEPYSKYTYGLIGMLYPLYFDIVTYILLKSPRPSSFEELLNLHTLKMPSKLTRKVDDVWNYNYTPIIQVIMTVILGYHGPIVYNSSFKKNKLIALLNIIIITISLRNELLTNIGSGLIEMIAGATIQVLLMKKFRHAFDILLEFNVEMALILIVYGIGILSGIFASRFVDSYIDQYEVTFIITTAMGGALGGMCLLPVIKYFQFSYWDNYWAPAIQNLDDVIDQLRAIIGQHNT